MTENVRIVDKVIGIPLKNEIGSFFAGAYKFINEMNCIEEVIILYFGDISKIENVRINSACYTSDLFGCNRCDCHDQLENALRYFVKEGNGLLLYMLSQDGRGCGTVNKLKSLLLMDEIDLTTKQSFEQLGLYPDNRKYAIAVAILKDLQITEINLLTNNPEKIDSLTAQGIKVKQRIPTICNRKDIQRYLKSKQKDFCHMIEA